MCSPAFLVFLFSVLLASNAVALSNDTDPTTTFAGFSFVAKTTPNADKGSSDNHTLLNSANLVYTGKVNVGGHDFTVIVDTGSSDLWVAPGSQKLKLNSTTNTTLNLTYGIGSAYGTIAYAPVALGGYQVDNQVFLSVSKITDQESEGILGLGLNGLSAIERKIKQNATAAETIMANLFAQHPSTPRFIGLALERSESGEDTAGGYISIGEYDPKYVNVSSTPRVPVTPTSESRWTIALEGMVVDGKPVPLRSGVKGTKEGQAIALIDSGTSLAYVPSDAVDALYGKINGSVHVKASGQDAWFVPCLGQVNLSFTFGNIAYPINPMELTTPVRVTEGDKEYTVCINAFRKPLDGTERELDFLLGDVFMRNVYSVFNFGNASPTHEVNADANGASIQFLSRTNRDQVYADFERHRKNALMPYPPLFDLTKLHADGTTEGGGQLQPPSGDL